MDVHFGLVWLTKALPASWDGLSMPHILEWNVMKHESHSHSLQLFGGVHNGKALGIERLLTYIPGQVHTDSVSHGFTNFIQYSRSDSASKEAGFRHCPVLAWFGCSQVTHSCALPQTQNPVLKVLNFLDFSCSSFHRLSSWRRLQISMSSPTQLRSACSQAQSSKPIRVGLETLTFPHRLHRLHCACDSATLEHSTSISDWPEECSQQNLTPLDLCPAIHTLPVRLLALLPLLGKTSLFKLPFCGLHTVHTVDEVVAKAEIPAGVARPSGFARLFRRLSHIA